MSGQTSESGDGITTGRSSRLGLLDWETSLHWKEQRQLATLSRESGAPHNYARAAARSSKSNALGSVIPISGLSSGQSTTVFELAASLVKEKEKQLQEASTAGSTPGRPSTRHAANPREQKEKREKERQQSINESNKQFWTAIDLSGQGLLTVAPRLVEYQFLQELFLNHNNLSSVPVAITRMPQLRVLDLSSNHISDLPPEMGVMIGLRYLFVFDNNLNALPSEFGSLFQLEVFGIEGNPIDDYTRSIIATGGTRGLIEHLRDNAPAGDPPRPRQWLQVDKSTAGSASGGNNNPSDGLTANVVSKPAIRQGDGELSIFSYNILCDRYATPQLYGYTPSWALTWDYRQKLLMKEVLGQDTDLICLQEVNKVAYDDVLRPQLVPRGYDSIFFPKTRAKTMSSQHEADQVDGCATFFKTAKYKLVKKYEVEYHSRALSTPDISKTEDLFNRVANRDNVALIAVFELVETRLPIVVANTHLHWDPAFKDVKLVQSAILIDEVQSVVTALASNGNADGSKYPSVTDIKQVPVLICGDFNSTQDSGVYQLFSTSHVPARHPDFEGYSYGNFTDKGIKHNLTLRSGYADVHELPFTNYTPEFVEAIDYIWYSTHTLDVNSLYGPVDAKYAKHYVGFPNPHHPSDHVPVALHLKRKLNC